jgi:hypothetical protein
VDFDIRPQRALTLAVEQLLRPLCRLLLRHSVSFGALEAMAKRVYVDVAYKEFSIPGKKPTTSRVAVLSGLTRKEVQHLLTEPIDAEADVADRYNRAARVLTGWARDVDFIDAEGQPRLLDSDGERSFAALVKRHSGDMPARAVLDELVRVGAVRQRDDGRLELLTRAYVPQTSAVDKLGILGSDVADLITTIDHNLQHGAHDPRFQRKVMYDAIPVTALPAFRKLSAHQAQALLEKMDAWLATHDIETSPESPQTACARVGLGIYYFEEHLETNVVEGDQP